jgi:Transposase DDE domain
VSVAIPLGSVSPSQECRQTAYAFGCAGQHSDQCLCDWGQIHDVNLLDQLFLEAGAFYLLDRGYVDFARLYIFTQACAFFVTRAKKNMQFYRRSSRPIERSTGLRSDQTILLTGVRTAQHYPDPLRRIHYFDVEKDSRLIFLSNNFLLPPLTIAQLYRTRWQVELFFCWIKQHLHITAFYGTSENAVKTQVWVALSVYALVAIVKKQLGLDLSLYKILQILSVTIFEKTPILEGFSNFADESDDLSLAKQLKLFEF